MKPGFLKISVLTSFLLLILMGTWVGSAWHVHDSHGPVSESASEPCDLCLVKKQISTDTLIPPASQFFIPQSWAYSFSYIGVPRAHPSLRAHSPRAPPALS